MASPASAGSHTSPHHPTLRTYRQPVSRWESSVPKQKLTDLATGPSLHVAACSGDTLVPGVVDKAHTLISTVIRGIRIIVCQPKATSYINVNLSQRLNRGVTASRVRLCNWPTRGLSTLLRMIVKHCVVALTAFSVPASLRAKM
jgi:hypothetical protein